MQKILLAIGALALIGSALYFSTAEQTATPVIGSPQKSYNNINQEFESVLNGQTPLTPEIFEKILSQYQRQFNANSVNTVQLQNKINEIIFHNARTDVSYKKGLNQYSHLTDEEFTKLFKLDQTAGQECSATENRMSVMRSHAEVPDAHDWRQSGGVSPVKNQGGCGSCWTFSTVGALEAHSLIKYGKFVSLSEQQLVDCAGDFDNYGCSGGLPSHAFEYVAQAGGISTEQAYPYYAKNRPCTVDANTFALKVNGGSVNITAGDEQEAKVALFTHGPLSIAFQVVGDFRDYSTGVYSSTACKNGQQDVNHAVLAVGYGTENGKDYWIVKNSWGAAWGDNGYFKIERGVNMCGVAVCNSFPNEVELL